MPSRTRLRDVHLRLATLATCALLGGGACGLDSPGAQQSATTPGARDDVDADGMPDGGPDAGSGRPDALPAPDLLPPPVGEPPVLAAVSPAAGPSDSVVELRGAAFRAGDLVELRRDGALLAPATTLSLATDRLVALLPALAEGLLTVAVRRDDQTVSAARPFVVTPGATHYVAPGGSDDDDGTRAAPWATLDQASARMASGDVTYVRGGLYAVTSSINLHGSGKPGAPVTFAAHPGETVTLVQRAVEPGVEHDTLRIWGSWVVVDGFHVTDENDPGQVVWIDYDAHDDVIRRCDLYGSRGEGLIVSGHHNLVELSRVHDNGNGSHHQLDHGMYIEGAHNVIRRNLVYGNWTMGIQLYNGYGTTNGYNVVEENYVYGNGFGLAAQQPDTPSAGIVVGHGHPGNVIRNNRVCGNARHGIYVIDEIPGTRLRGNLTCFNGDGGLVLESPGADTVVDHHISYDDAPYALAAVDGVASDDNVYYTSTGAPVFRFDDAPGDLAALRLAAGTDGNSRVEDPHFAHPPVDAFDPAAAAAYDFTTALNPALAPDAME